MGLQREISVEDDTLSNAIDGTGYLLFDGGMGSLIQQAGLDGVHEVPDILNFTHPEEIEAIQRRYVEAGADVVTTNTFSSNSLKLEGSGYTVSQAYEAAVQIARKAGAKLVAGDIGPTGLLLAPMGEHLFDDVYEVFAEQAKAAEAAGCDLVVIETMADLAEAKAAVLAAVENTSLPVFATMTFSSDGRTFLGTTPAIAATTLSSLGVQAVGINCSVGPDDMAPLVGQLAGFSRCAVMAQPNAGIPRIENGSTVYDVTPSQFADAMREVIAAGATIVGGCCGTTPEHIQALAKVVGEFRSSPSKGLSSGYRRGLVVASPQEMVFLPEGKQCVYTIGERINPTGRKSFANDLKERRLDSVVAEAVAQQNAGASILDVNVGVPGVDEVALLCDAVEVLRSTVTIPLQLDSSNCAAIEAAARRYPGRVMVNSVNGSRESLESVLPIVAHYGCCVVGLTLDEGGIPSTFEERLDIARRIVDEAKGYGVPEEDIAIDCLVMAASTNPDEVQQVLNAVSEVKRELGVRTVLGVSNVSFGLPQRSMVNATFLASALGAGLDLPILNPLDRRYRDTVAAFRVLNGQDEGCKAFIAEYAGAVDPYDESKCGQDGSGSSEGVVAGRPSGNVIDSCLVESIDGEFADDGNAVEAAECVMSGRKGPMAALTGKILGKHDRMSVINGLFIPLLDVVGQKYESGEFFLPQLMASAEAVKAGFDVIRSHGEDASLGAAFSDDTKTVVVATVKGDIHDIGKNIAGMLLENYGYDVIDLGRDVSPDKVVEAVKQADAKLVGLSALMTTTVGAMEETVDAVHEECPGVPVMVSGAVVTQDYADSIGADFYAKDASASARIAAQVFSQS